MTTKRLAFRRHRSKMGYTQESLAEKIGVDRTTIVRWERGDTTPQPNLRTQLADTLRIELDDLDQLLSDTPPPHIPLLPPQTTNSSGPLHNPTNPRKVKIIIEAPAWYLRQPTVHAITTALVTDPDGNILLVKPNRRRWTLPGGTVAGVEPPHTYCARILGEDLALTRTIGDLLAVDWSRPTGTHRAAVHLIFDGGTVPAGTAIHVTTDDLDDAAFLTPEHATTVLPADTSARISAALLARKAKKTTYLYANQQPTAAARTGANRP